MRSILRCWMLRNLARGALCVATTVALDCAPLNSNVAIAPSESIRYRHRAIEVVTRDGRVIDYRSNSYHIIESADSIVIEGTGQLKRRGGLFVNELFRGTIPQSQIERISLIKQWDPDNFGGILLLIILTIPFAFTSLTS